MIGLFPGDGSQDIHNFWATLFFLGGLSYCILYGISELKAKGISKIQAISGFVVAFSFIVFIFFTAFNYFKIELALDLSHFLEWILFGLLTLWMIEHQVSMMKNK